MRLLTLALLLAVPASAHAEAHTHDGYFFRFNLGVGFGSLTSEIDDEPDLDVSGAIISGTAAFGGALTESLVIYGLIGMLGFAEANLDVAGVDAVEAEQSSDETLFGVGLGASYYFMPSNTYVGGAILLRNYTGSGSVNLTSVQITGGKEWWYDDEWGTGVALTAEYGAAEFEGTDYETLSVQIGLSATFN